MENDEFVFNPEMISVEDGGIAPPEKKEEKLNLLQDTIFDQEKIEDNNDDGVDKDIDKNTPDPEDTKKDDPSSKTVFSVVLGQDLMDRGVISSFDEETIKKIAEEEGESAAIMAMMENQAKSIADELKTSYDQNYQEYLTMIQGGVSKEEATGIQQLESFVSSFENLDLKGEDDAAVQARKDILTLNYRLSTKFSEDKIKRLVDRAYEEGFDIEEVDEAKESLISYVSEEKTRVQQEAKSRQEELKKSQEKIVSDYKTFISKTDEYFKGEKISQQTKDKIEKMLLNPVKTNDGRVTNEIWAKRDKDPISFDSKIAYLDLIGYFDDKPLDKFMKIAETKSTSRLDSYLSDNEGRNFMKSRGKSFSDSSGNKSDFLDF